MTFGDRLRKARLNKGLTQEQLAQQIGVAKSTLTGYEKGNREPDMFKIKKILEVLEIDSDYLLGLSPQPEKKVVPVKTPIGFEQLTSEFQDIVNNLINQLLTVQNNIKK